jgi:hypothetical protein
VGGIVLGSSFFLLGIVFVLGRDPDPQSGLIFIAIGVFVLLLGLQREDSPGGPQS